MNVCERVNEACIRVEIMSAAQAGRCQVSHVNLCISVCTFVEVKLRRFVQSSVCSIFLSLRPLQIRKQVLFSFSLLDFWIQGRIKVSQPSIRASGWGRTGSFSWRLRAWICHLSHNSNILSNLKICSSFILTECGTAAHLYCFSWTSNSTL